MTMTLTRAEIIIEDVAVERVVGESLMELSAPQKGALWLDENHPGWAERMDLTTFNIQDATMCVLGQLYTNDVDAGYWVGMEEHHFSSDDAVEYGFHAHAGPATAAEQELAAQATYPEDANLGASGSYAWSALQAEWQQIIRERQESA